MGKWQIVYLRTRYRSKLGWFFWFSPIHVTIRRSLDINLGFIETHCGCLQLRFRETEVPADPSQVREGPLPQRRRVQRGMEPIQLRLLKGEYGIKCDLKLQNVTSCDQ